MTQTPPDTHTFQRSLGLLDGTMLVAGSMIGSGIFIVSADIARNVGSAGYLILVWVLTAIMTVVAAVSYGELSAMYPRAGGQYVYLREAYNKLIGFLYGWAFFAVIQTGTIAAVGVAFSKFAAYLFPAVSDKNILWEAGAFKLNAAQLVSIAMIVLLTWINSRGIKQGKIIQTTFTLAKLASLLGLIAFGLMFASDADVWNANWTNAWAGPAAGWPYSTWEANWSPPAAVGQVRPSAPAVQPSACRTRPGVTGGSPRPPGTSRPR